MEQLDSTIFLFINSSSMYTGSLPQQLAVFTAEWLVWALPLLLAWIWIRGDFRLKKAAMSAALSAAIALCAGGLIGWQWPQPRPFMLGLGHLLINHAPDASLPSDHLTLWWGISLGLAVSPNMRRIGLSLALAGLAPAWARIYAGVHFPADMLAALLVSLGAACLVSRYGSSLATKATWAGVQLQRVVFPLWKV